MFEYTVSYKKAWKAKQKAIARVYGNWENSYRLLPRWLAAVSHFVPGTIVRYQYKEDGQSAQVANFKRVFWAFKPCIDALPYLKPIVQIDGTFLYGKYRGTLLIATSQDSDTHVVPFAFAIVEGENKEAWSWFLSNIRQHVVKERQNLCLISYRHGGILSVVADERIQWHPPYAHHVFCIRHLASNLNSEHKDPWLKKTLINMGYELMSNRVEEMLAEEYWPSAPGPTLEADVGMLRKKGRPRSTRIGNEMDWRERGESPLCGLCRNSGHNRATCPEHRRQPGGA
ncbi:Auxin response factor 4 [Senna tora]|uniref:Auxin response factor 4 n=1 Tax=Senna tora TaxID=362788 RepID=A0A834T0D4_9FABA|nr:Auxin response factor 4 [Senna tora]